MWLSRPRPWFHRVDDSDTRWGLGLVFFTTISTSYRRVHFRLHLGRREWEAVVWPWKIPPVKDAILTWSVDDGTVGDVYLGISRSRSGNELWQSPVQAVGAQDLEAAIIKACDEVQHRANTEPDVKIIHPNQICHAPDCMINPHPISDERCVSYEGRQ